MGVSVGLAALLFVVGLATLFLAPWVGGGLLIVAVVVALLGMTVFAAKADDAPPREARDVEAPHMPGPGNPESGVD
jgi:hypothetical protein